MKAELIHRDVRTTGGHTAYTLCSDSEPVTFGWPGAPAVASVPRSHAGLGPYTRAIALLYRLKAYKAGWSGPRSSAADKRSFDAAIQFLELLADRLHTDFAVEPTIFAEGTAVLEVERADLRMLLEFTSDGLIAANIDRGQERFDLDIEDFDGNTFPSELDVFLKC